MANPLNIGVVGASGRMGRMVVSIIAASDDCRLAGATEAPGSEHVGADAGALAPEASRLTPDSGFADLAAYILIDVADPLTLVRLRWPESPNFCTYLAHSLLVTTLHDNFSCGRSLDFYALGHIKIDRVRKTERKA